MSRVHTRAQLRRQEGALPLVFGHRGARHGAPENTLAAFELAAEEGAAGVELDVRETADGQLVIFHDPVLSVLGTPTAGGRRQVEIHSLCGSQVDHLQLASQMPLLRLSDALEFSHESGLWLNIELKGDLPAPLAMTARVAHLIRSYEARLGQSLQVFFSSFHPGIVGKLRLLLPDYCTGLLVEQQQKWMSRALPYRLFGADLLHPQACLVTAELVHAVHGRSGLVNVWTVNDPEEARRLADFGVDVLMSDCPGRILAALKR